MPKATRVVHTPGEQPAAADSAAQTNDGQAEQDAAGAQQESADDELTRLRAEVAALKADKDARAERDALITASDKAAMSEKLTSNTPAAGLRAVDVDPTKIKRAVLTLDGWVCPVEAPQYGARR